MEYKLSTENKWSGRFLTRIGLFTKWIAQLLNN